MRMEDVFVELIQVIQEWMTAFLENLPSYIVALVILILSVYISRWVKMLVVKGLKARDTDSELVLLLGRLTQWTIVIFGIVLGLQQTGTDVSALVTGLGVLGVTIGFALQDVAQNFVAGILLLIQQPFDIGDAIEVAGYSGTVKTVDIRATEILTFDGLMVTIPNGDVFTSTLTNYTRNPIRRISLDLGVDYESDLKFVEKVCKDTIQGISEVSKEKDITVVFHTFASSTINLTVFFWVDTREYGYFDVQTKGVMEIKKAFEQNKINMPYPIQMVLRKDIS